MGSGLLRIVNDLHADSNYLFGSKSLIICRQNDRNQHHFIWRPIWMRIMRQCFSNGTRSSQIVFEYKKPATVPVFSSMNYNCAQAGFPRLRIAFNWPAQILAVYGVLLSPTRKSGRKLSSSPHLIGISCLCDNTHPAHLVKLPSTMLWFRCAWFDPKLDQFTCFVVQSRHRRISNILDFNCEVCWEQGLRRLIFIMASYH